ncbi:MAG: metal-dependent hydrolase [Candidatus Acidiferrales bacterium]
MEPVTHVLASAALARGVFDRTRFAMPVAAVAALAVDLDWLALAGGAETYLTYYRVLTHSLIGSATVAIAVGALFWLAGRKHPTRPASLVRLLTVALAAAWLHVLLDLMNPHGVALFWPVNSRRFAWDLAGMLDPWLLAVLLAGWLLPTLLRLVAEEIGAKAERKGPRRWAIGTIVLAALYCGARWYLHGNAIALLDSRVYHGAAPRGVAALPDSPSPFTWRGLVETENTYEEIEVPAGPGGFFDSDRSVTMFKPEGSPALAAAQNTSAVQQFVAAARFPLASVEQISKADGMPDGGFRVTVRDLRFTEGTTMATPVVVIIEMDSQLRVLDERFEFREQD